MREGVDDRHWTGNWGKAASVLPGTGLAECIHSSEASSLNLVAVGSYSVALD